MTGIFRSVPEASTLKTILAECWSSETSSLWTANVPSRGQCGVTALVFRDHFGGEILKTPVGRKWHFYNRIDGKRLDLTRDQFEQPITYLDLSSSRDEAMADCTAQQYRQLSRRFSARLSEAGLYHHQNRALDDPE